MKRIRGIRGGQTGMRRRRSRFRRLAVSIAAVVCGGAMRVHAPVPWGPQPAGLADGPVAVTRPVEAGVDPRRPGPDGPPRSDLAKDPHLDADDERATPQAVAPIGT